MAGSCYTLLNYGKWVRIWPNTDINHNDLYVSVGLGRPFVKPLCNLLMSRDYGESWTELADFHLMDRRNTTTGQPFVTNEGILFIATWNAGFYTHGTTWLAIYKSEDHGLSWEKMYDDPRATYGNHFFQNAADGSVYVGVGVGGGGSKGRIGYTPAKSYLLKSEDLGKTWKKVLKINHPVAIYSGAVINDRTVLITAREKKSVFRSIDNGNSWSETYIGNSARSILYVNELDKVVMTSNDSIFISSDGETWVRVKAPLKGLVLRYPVLYKGKLLMAGLGLTGYSFVILTDLNSWYVVFDVTKKTGNIFVTRMAVIDDYVFLGHELNGVLLRTVPRISDCKLIASQLLKIYLGYLFSIMKNAIREPYVDKLIF